MGVKTRRSSRTRGPSQAAPRKRRTPREAATGCLGDPEDPWRDTSQRPLDLQVAAVAIAREKHKHPPCVLNPRNTVHCGKRLDTPGRQMRAAAAFLPRHAKALKTKKGLKGSIDDVLGDLLGDDTALLEKPVEPASHAKDTASVPQWPPSKAKGRSLPKDSVDGLLGADAEDLDSMDDDLFGRMKSHPPSGKGTTKGSGKEVPSNPKPAGALTANDKGDAIPAKKSPPPSSNYGLQYKKFSFEDFEDPLAGLLSDEEEETAKKPPTMESKPVSKSPSTATGHQGPSVPLTPGDTPIRKKELLFDEGDDIMTTLGFEDSPKEERKKTGDQEGPLPARSKLDELLGRGTAAKLLTRPGTGERREFKLDKKYQKPEDKEDSWDDEILTFGAYQPTVASSEGRQSRRQSVNRFLGEGGSDLKGDLKGEAGFRHSPPPASSPAHPRRGGADWLGLKDDDLDLLSSSPVQKVQQEDSAISTPSLPPPINQHSAPEPHPAPVGLPSAAKPAAKGVRPSTKASQASLKASEEKEDDWLSHVISQKKSQGLAREDRAEPSKGLNSRGSLGQTPSSSQSVAGTQALEQAIAEEASRTIPQGIAAGRPGITGSSMRWSQATTVLPVGDPKTGMVSASGDFSSREPALYVPRSQEPTGLSVPIQPLLPESVVQSLLPGSGYQKQLLAAQGQLQGSTAQLQAELLQSQTKLSELEAQVRKLELERTQHRVLLESLQQRHQADLALIEDAHRSRVKVLEASYQQREEQLLREKEALSAQHASYCREAEQARAELIAQHQRHLAMAAQEKDQEVARLRELQQASILEMRKDHEHQLQRLKVLKDQEIDAVTSATSHTRSLNGIIEQMERFSSSLTVLSSRVEASHLNTSQERELGIRQQDEQLRALQERLGRQQRDMEEERSRLQEVIGKMEVRLSEQSRLLEQERWQVATEKSKAESAQRTLEEQRRLMVQQISMEREELERAKSALLEEQKSVMNKCGEERRRLAAEWAEYFTQQKLSKERAEREAERALHADSQREDTIISLTKEQAELTVRACELRAKEEKLAAEREALERERQELRLEKDRLHKASLRLQARVQEVEHMSKVASKKYEEGEQALQEAQQMQSEQQGRLQAVQRQQEWLRQQEQRMHKEHLSLAQQRLQLDRVRQEVPSSLLGQPSTVQGPAVPSLDAVQAPAPTSPQCSQTPAAPVPTHLLAKLLLLKHTAAQDHDFLENEQFFLETLKKAPYNMAYHSA
ncbi:fas-binding factor 1 isoform X4 [Cricetulus griseus]|uniref:Fas-binding factor 1 isoform X18 n=1 Tax=Cricetulus griseus TaxID=10029 RepID=A0A9J7GDK3_CRIGR|nr:fas-binding factor 1 isoform X4 [Cricetulus griseus]XP_027281420.1 fas-binding factor 1 isoform X18 [Cricetulus griseus]